MKKIILVLAVLAIFQKWDDISRWFNPPPDYSELYDADVILYATTWCGYCEKARELLAKYNISYHEFDIEKSDEGRKQYEELGGRGVPLLLINGEVVKGYNKNKILDLVKES